MNKQSSFKNKLRQINTSLRDVSAALNAAETILPVLFKAYEVAVNHKLLTPLDSKARLNLLRLIMPELRREVDEARASLIEVSKILNGS